MAFSEVREYQWGDDVRQMDWNVTARLRQPYVKVFEEERELTVMLLVDVSRSGLFGTVETTKRERIAEIAAVLSFSAILNNDKVGALFFSDKVEKFIPPKKGRKHILLVIRELLNFKPESRGTNIGNVLEYLTSALKKHCATFLISDFIDGNDYYKAMSIASRKHDLTAIQVYDKREATLPNVGLMKVEDAETGAVKWVNTSSASVRNAYKKWWYERQQTMNNTLMRCNVDIASVATDEDYVKSLMALFGKRGVR